MDRRNALKIFGMLFVCLAGRPVLADTEKGDNFLTSAATPFFEPTNYHFSEKGMGNIIIERKNGKMIVIPFADIIEALDVNG